MRYAAPVVRALASLLAVQGRTISPRQPYISSQQSVAASFRQVTRTYYSISESFSLTSQSIQSATTFEQCSNILHRLQYQISQALESISGGCNCRIDDVDTNTLQTTISTWFSQFQSIAEVVQTRFPSSYRSQFRSTFTQISRHMQLALGVAHSAGVDMDNVVLGAVRQARVNPQIFSDFNVHISSFTHISQQVQTRTGLFRGNRPVSSPLPGYPGRGHKHYHHTRPNLNPSPFLNHHSGLIANATRGAHSPKRPLPDHGTQH